MKLKYTFLLLFTFSCSPTIKNFSNYQKEFLTKSSFLPSEEALLGKAAKIAVFNFDENGNEVATQSGIGSAMAITIENVLQKYRLGDLIDRKATEKLQKEIALAEAKKTGSYKGLQVADYAISGSISNAGFTKKYSSGSTYFDPRSKTLVTIPPSFTYKGEVSGNIKIYELPSMSVLGVIDLSGKTTRTESVQQKGGLLLGGLQIGGEQTVGIDRDDNLVRRASEDAINNAIPNIRNALAQKGYIIEKRTYDGKTIFKINLGSENGLSNGDKFDITGQFESENPITGKIEIEKRLLATGVISDKIDPKTSWIIIDDEKKEKQIRMGDVVKLKYEKSFFDSVKKIAKSFFE